MRDWDIFCKVVDNYGDIGVCWRLARQLTGEHRLRVRLWLDDLASFRRFNAAIDPLRDEQECDGVVVRRWNVPFPRTEPAQVVVETFGCDVPAEYVLAMARRVPAPVWINLEYLSAEDWVAGCHRLPSPHPRLPLQRHFFFPGFAAGTGGLLREKGLFESMQAFRWQPKQAMALWDSLRIPAPSADVLTVTLFCYENPALHALLSAWASAGAAVRCLAFEGVAALDAQRWFVSGEQIGVREWRRGSLEFHVLPFVAPPQYDRLLWAADVNFVRGEDSFVRAQWAAKPFVWHIYPQKENAHWVKLNAFIDRYVEKLPGAAAQALRGFWRAWVAGRGADAAWPAFLAQRKVLERHAANWANEVAQHGDLASNLVRFASELLK